MVGVLRLRLRFFGEKPFGGLDGSEEVLKLISGFFIIIKN